MTPIFYHPTHVYDKQYSNIFHRDHPGKLVVVFHGPNHELDANEFCKKYGEPDGNRTKKMFKM